MIRSYLLDLGDEQEDDGISAPFFDEAATLARLRIATRE